jgi:hypothetical protein
MEPDVRRVAPGRLPERVYWFRRAFVVVCLAIVIALLMWLVSLVGGSKTAAPAVTKAAPTTTRTPSPPDSLQATALPAPATAPEPSTTPTATATATDQPTTASASAPAPAACDPGAMSLSIAGPGTVKAGASAQLTITVTNSGTDACTFTFDARFTLKIVSGADEIWSTADCSQWAPTASQALPPGGAATWQTTWDRHRSQATCKVVPATLKDGTYVASAMYAGASTAQLVMLLTA